MQKITPFLWFDEQAEEAAEFYVSLFDDSRIVAVTHYDEAGAKVSGRPEGSVMTVAFELAGQSFVALNGGPHFTFSGATSFVVNCETQEEIDRFWEKLSEAGGEAGQCGWINHDKFGVTWQVVPSALGDILGGADPAGSKRAMEAMFGMTKLDIAALKRAYAGEST